MVELQPLAEFVIARIEEELGHADLDRHRRRELEEVLGLARRARGESDQRLAGAFVIVLQEIAARHEVHPDFRDEWRVGRRLIERP